MTYDTLSNSDDLIDLRNVIACIEGLEDDLDAAYLKAEGVEPDCIDRDNLASAAADDEAHPMHDEAVEYLTLNEFMDECKGNGGDEKWRGAWYPVTAVRGSYFVTYAQSLAEELGNMPDNLPWPWTCVDWEQAARELQMDYTAVYFDGVTYWVR